MSCADVEISSDLNAFSRGLDRIMAQISMPDVVKPRIADLPPHHCKYDDPEVAHPQWRKRQEQQNNPLSIEYQFEGPMKNLYFPFGSAGGGAPNVDPDGNMQPLILSEQTLRVRFFNSYQFDSEIPRSKCKRKLPLSTTPKSLMQDLAEIIAKGQTGRPRRDKETGRMLNQGLRSTDVTNWNYNAWKHLKSDSSSTMNDTDERAAVEEDKSKTDEMEKVGLDS
ncbi:hypothetical protein Ciccas_007023 [Cichlidogyrus casuarinus]|uniref:Uncharacterized protein n=1 Tax=Cichlidogyrus casuarinus TaxID=1844966 RepID=A0ABD2Q4M3_9PLAT